MSDLFSKRKNISVYEWAEASGNSFLCIIGMIVTFIVGTIFGSIGIVTSNLGCNTFAAFMVLGFVICYVANTRCGKIIRDYNEQK